MKKLVSLLLIAAMMVTAAFALTSCGKVKIGVQAGTTGQYYVDGDADWGFDGLAGYQSVGFNKLLKFLCQYLSVFFFLHVDKVYYYHSRKISQP